MWLAANAAETQDRVRTDLGADGRDGDAGDEDRIDREIRRRVRAMQERWAAEQ